MGKTIDKCAVCRASRIIRQFASGKVSQEKKKPDLLPLGRDFVSELTKQLIPFGDVSVGAVEARLGAEEIGVSGLPLDVASVIQKQLIDLVVSEEVSLFVIEPQPTPHPHRGVLVVPVPAIYPRINK
jgi:hypothetical protein